uniref:Uncharacterized protein n=1 Tax=Musa acuminata subsp. malaccensis TaxID=214687 RepID=A0A804JG29_MUSAM
MQLRVLIFITSGRAIGRGWAGEMDGDGSGRPTRRLLLLILSISLQLIPGKSAAMFGKSK